MNGVLRLYDDDDSCTMIEHELNLLPCVDDGTMMFDDRESLTKGSRIICEVMAKWGLTVHVGHSGKKSETELMFIPSTSTIARWRKGLPILMDKVKGDDNSSLVGRKSKKLRISLRYMTVLMTLGML